MTLYPASDQRTVYSPFGYPLPNAAYRVYTDSAATVPATIYADSNGAQGAVIANSRIYSNQRSVLPQFHANGVGTLYGKPDGYAGPITALKPDPASTQSLAAKVSKGELTLNVLDFGAKGDGTTDDTNAIQAALTMASPGTAVFIPSGYRFKFSTLNIDGSQRLTGGYYYVNRDSVGSNNGMRPEYLAAGNVVGSVLVSTATSGNAVNIVRPSIHAGAALENLAIVGPGSGTSVGVRIGQHTPSLNAVLAPVFHNVMVCNFATGILAHHMNEALMTQVLIKGCSKAISCVDDVNDVTWVKLNIQRCAQGLVQESGGLCYSNSFVGFIGQNITGEAFVLRGESHVLTNPYFELVATGGNVIDVAAASYCEVISPNVQGAGSRVLASIANGSNFNTFRGVKLSSTITMVNNGTSTMVDGNLDNGSRITGSGGNPIYVDRNNAYIQAPAYRATSGSQPSIQTTNNAIRNGTSGPRIFWRASGTPEGQETAPVGSVCILLDNGAMYRKTSGTGNTGWVVVA